MKHIRRLAELALMLMTMAALSVGTFAADYSFETGAGTEYYPATSYADTYGAAYNYGGPNLVDYQIPELPYGVSSTTQIGIMEKGYCPACSKMSALPFPASTDFPAGSMIFPPALYLQLNRACWPIPALTTWSVRMAVLEH